MKLVEFTFSNFFMKIMPFLNNVEKYGTVRKVPDDNLTQRMNFVFRITKATDSHSECAIFTVIPRQQWLRERVSTVR
jgi:hypothetical protein